MFAGSPSCGFSSSCASVSVCVWVRVCVIALTVKRDENKQIAIMYAVWMHENRLLSLQCKILKLNVKARQM